jgi:hypothetical protein
MDRPSTMVHELMHVLSNSGEHADTGVFTSMANRDQRITEDSLNRLCAGFECSTFQPE